LAVFGQFFVYSNHKNYEKQLNRQYHKEQKRKFKSRIYHHLPGIFSMMSSNIKKPRILKKQGSNWSFHLEKSQKFRENDATRHTK